jgi:isopentenyl-diphosphate delta-isomerase
MDDVTRDPNAKLRHIDVCLTRPVEYTKPAGFESWDLLNEALPELSLAEIDTRCTLAGVPMQAPLMIAPMTGGTERGQELNRRLAVAAQAFGLALAVGSQRVAIEDPTRIPWFDVRELAPDCPVFANLGAAQLVRGYGIDQARRAVEMIRGDALFVHLNAVQEAVQGGDLDFRGVARRLTELCRELEKDAVPVFAREVCFGMTESTARRLIECGVTGIDCSGAGGTSWAKVEAWCAETAEARDMALRFGEWGIPTSESIVNVRRASPETTLIASGGLRSGIDLAKSLALGADVGAMARTLLIKADEGESPLHRFLESTLAELRICMFATGSRTVPELRGKVRRIVS